MKNSSIVKVVLLGTIAVIGIIAVQAYYISEAWSLKDKEFDQRVRIVLRKVAEHIASFNDSTLPSYNLIRRESSNYYLVNIDDEIDANILEHYLQSELSNASLELDFEYAVFDCFSKEMVYGNYCLMESDTEVKRVSKLPKYDEFIYYFGVRFPNKLSYTLQSTSRFWVAAAVLFLTLLFFAYAVYIILSQRRMSEMQRDFINNMTHEFKTPISSIKISSDMLSQNEDIKGNKKLSKYVEIIREQQNRLNLQVEKILSLAKLEKDQFKLKKEDLDVNELIEEVVRTRVTEVEKAEGAIAMNLSNNLIPISADRIHFSNILHNLLDNAIKYSGAGASIEVRSFRRGEKTIVEIQDQGMGIAAEHLHKLHKKFFRVPSGDVHDVKGFGLGLFYVHRTCRSHKWRFEIESEVNKGTTCRIII